MSHIHIDVSDLRFAYSRKSPEAEALSEISFHAGEEEAIGIIGANGAGKSTLLKLLVGLEMPSSGTVRIEEIPLEKGTLGKIREKIGYVFQDSDAQLFMTTVEEDVMFAPRNYGLPEEEVRRRTARALEETGISHLAKKPVYQLSGGEKKLASLSTILSMTPDILLLDEPSAALDPRNRRNLIRILQGFGHLMLIASHDLDFIWDICGRVILLDHGRIIKDGPAEEILRDRELLEAHGLELPLSLQGRR